MYSDIFDNYFTFYNMVLSSTIMGNSPQKELYEDVDKIIDFIGKAENVDDAFIEKCKGLIKHQLAEIALTSDRLAVYSERRYDDVLTQEDVLIDIKCDVIFRLSELQNKPDAGVNPGWFDYSHYKSYDAKVRFSKIETAAASGNVVTARQTAILKALGVGCKKDLTVAAKRFMQCALWGDIASMKYLAYVYKLQQNEKLCKVFEDVTILCRHYLKLGVTVLPEDVKAQYSKEASTYYTYISTIVQDIVHAYNKKNIDFSFIEAITCDKLDYYDILGYINNYERKEWKSITNPIEKPVNNLGFI